MNIDSRLRSVQESLKSREMALFWLKTSQARGGYFEYWQNAEFQPWASENEEAGLLYHLAVEVNSTVVLAADNWRALAGWAALLGISMIVATPESKPVQFENLKDLSERWRQKLRTFLAEVVALEQAVELISQGYFDGHDVLFIDTKEHLTSSHKIARELITGYNWFAENNGKERIDLDGDPGCAVLRVKQRLNEWVMLARSKALSAQGKIFEARDEVLSWLNPDK